MNYMADGLTDYQISRSTILTAYNSKVTPKKKPVKTSPKTETTFS